MKGLPDECGVFLAGLNAPPAPFVPAELHFTLAFALIVVGLGSAEAHAELLAPVRAALSPRPPGRRQGSVDGRRCSTPPSWALDHADLFR